MSFDEARQNSGLKGNGIGYHCDDGEFIVDFDDCFNAAGDLKPERKKQVDALNTYTEGSPGSQGLHVVGRGKKPGPKCRRGGVEIYDHTGNFLTFTGNHLEGTPRTIEARRKPQTTSTPRLSKRSPQVGGGGGSKPQHLGC